MVNRFAPRVVAPRLVRAPEAVDAPVPPSVIAKSVPRVREDKYVIAATTSVPLLYTMQALPLGMETPV